MFSPQSKRWGTSKPPRRCRICSPIAGTLTRFNADLLNDPSAINVDMYGAGWLFEMAGADLETLSVQEYHDLLAAGWEKTQNMLKGHM